MISFEPTQVEELSDAKSGFIRQLVFPLDGMWEAGIFNPAPHWKICIEGTTAGFFCANDAATLLQFYLHNEYLPQMGEVLGEVIKQHRMTKAYVGTNDPNYLACCLDRQQKVAIHTLLYEVQPLKQRAFSEPFQKEALRLVRPEELEACVAFQRESLGGDENLTDWLRGYSGNLIKRNELFVNEGDEAWVSLGERRKSDTQTGVCDLGVMVAQEYRNQGHATFTLRWLSQLASSESLRAICSTTVDNIASRKAIANAGFVGHHRILEISF